MLVNRSNGYGMVGLGTSSSCGFSVSILTSACPSPMLMNVFYQTWSDSTRSSINTSRFCSFNQPSSICLGCSNSCSVGLFLLIHCTTWFTCCYFLFQELEIFSERKMLDVHVWHQIRPSWWRSRSVLFGGSLDQFLISVAPYKMAMLERSKHADVVWFFCLI